MGIIQQTIKIGNRLGLHARPAAELVKLAGKFRCEVSIGKDGMWVNGKSIMGVMTLAAEHGSTVTVRAEGDDAEEAMQAIVEKLTTSPEEE